MPLKATRREIRTYLELAVTIVVLLILIIVAAWAYYTSEGAVRHRAQVRMRDACFDQAKHRYQAYLRQNGQLQPDGSYTLPEKEMIFIENLRKEEYRQCSELYFVK